MRKSEYPQRSIKTKDIREDGMIGWSMGLFMVLYLSILMVTLLSIEQFQAASLYMEDALAASNLASAIVDLEEYGISHVLCLSEKETAYGKYVSAIKGNLNLNEDWMCANRKLISGKVNCEKYIIYNVRLDNVEILDRNSDGTWNIEYGRLGEVRAPNGVMVEHTGIYSEISFPIKAFFQIEVVARKGKLVDVVGKQ